MNTRRNQNHINQKLSTLEALVVRSEQFDVALEHMPHGLCMFDQETNLVLCNPAYIKLYGLPPLLTTAGTPLSQILDYRRLIGNAPRDYDHYFDVVHVALQTGDFASTRVPLQDGRTIQITHNPMPSGGYVATHENVTAHVAAEHERNFFASHDPLTRLLNRGAFISKLEHCIADARRPPMTLQLLDLDGFKPVNDTLGHQTGDHVLEVVAERLKVHSPENLICRLGGDEFAIVETYGSPDVAGKSASALIKAISQPIEVNSRQVKVGVSVGMAIFEHSFTSREIFHNADIAMYISKASGGSCATLFEAGMTMPEARADY